LDFLRRAFLTPNFFDATNVAAAWKIQQPFFSVPGGNGGLTSYLNAAAKEGVDLYRRLDKKTKAKTLFAKCGIPGSVGNATCSLWQEMGPLLLKDDDSFRVWPFEGDLMTLLKSSSIVLGEIYPRAAYSTALLDVPAESRPRLSLAKTDANVRRSAIEALKVTEWVREHGVRIDDLNYAQSNEDDFDACITAAALLRCELEREPFCGPWLEIDRIEGGMLGTGSMNLGLTERIFAKQSKVERTPKQPNHNSTMSVVHSRTAKTFRCPIAGCDKVYIRTRGGWDAPVGSLRIHPLWRSELISAEERKAQFAIEFPDFFV
jgi:hypothetical protein